MFDLKDIIFSAVCDAISEDTIRSAIETHIELMDFDDFIIDAVENSDVIEEKIAEAVEEVINSYLN